MCKGVEIGAEQKESKWETIGQLPPSVNFQSISPFCHQIQSLVERRMWNKVQFGVVLNSPVAAVSNFMFCCSWRALAKVGEAAIGKNRSLQMGCRICPSLTTKNKTSSQVKRHRWNVTGETSQAKRHQHHSFSLLWLIYLGGIEKTVFFTFIQKPETPPSPFFDQLSFFW